jgi:hypothetical protein
MKEGRNLETLVAALERAASNDPSIKIESPYFAIDRVTGSRREHDVGIIVTQTHHRMVIALECRDRSRNVTVPEVEAFGIKCQDTGVHKGGIVSSTGFAEDALVKAKHLNLGCYTLEEATDITWLEATSFEITSSHIISLNWLLIAKENPPTIPTAFHVEDAAGGKVPEIRFKQFMHEELPKHGELFRGKVGIHQLPFRISMEGFILCDDVNKQRYQLSHANVMAEVEVLRSSAPIRKLTYRDMIGGSNVIEAGVAPINVPGLQGNLFMVSGANGITVSFKVDDAIP